MSGKTRAAARLASRTRAFGDSLGGPQQKQARAVGERDAQTPGAASLSPTASTNPICAAPELPISISRSAPAERPPVRRMKSRRTALTPRVRVGQRDGIDLILRAPAALYELVESAFGNPDVLPLAEALFPGGK